MKTPPTLKLNRSLIACAAALLCSLGSSSAQTTNVIFLDTFDDGAGGLATRADDAGANYGLDIQWRPRVLSQAGSYSVVSDAVFGPALQFHNTANNLWIIGQFDNDVSDGVLFGSGSVPVSLNSVGDILIFSAKIRTSATLASGASFKCGLTFIPPGPQTDDGTTANAWTDHAPGTTSLFQTGLPGWSRRANNWAAQP
jgi:hypothetical protein